MITSFYPANSLRRDDRTFDFTKADAVAVALAPAAHDKRVAVLEERARHAVGELDRLGYGGFVGCEYNPRGKTTDGLAWFKPYAGARS